MTRDRRRRSTGVREISDGVFELRASAGRDPLTGKYPEVTRYFHGTFREAQVARAELVIEVKKGRHAGANATVDDLVPEWLAELERKNRSPRTIAEYERRYHHDIQTALGSVPVRKVTTKMLTDLYGAHQRRGQSPGSVRKIHATISSMMSQACRWGWRDTNPAEWAEPGPLEDVVPVVPTPAEVVALIEEARRSRRPEHAELMYFAATTGARRAEICALRRSRVDFENGTVLIERSIVKKDGAKLERPTKNRRRRLLAVDDRCLEALEAELRATTDRAAMAGLDVDEDPFIYTVSLTGDEPWDPDTITQYFGRIRDRLGYSHLTFKGFRRFMDTYGQELGFSMAQVAMRAGHDPAVAGRHYTGRVSETDRQIAAAMTSLLSSHTPHTGESTTEFRGKSGAAAHVTHRPTSSESSFAWSEWSPKGDLNS